MSAKIVSLSQLQRQFTRCLNILETKILSEGYEFTLGEGKRTPEQAQINALSLMDRARVAALIERQFSGLAEVIKVSTSSGIRNSNHINGLAQDLNLFKDDKFLDDAADYLPFGAYWKTLHPLARWGGDWGDADHFSFEYNGVK